MFNTILDNREMFNTPYTEMKKINIEKLKTRLAEEELIMKTEYKTIVIGSPEEKPALKPIVFNKLLTTELVIENVGSDKPSDYNTIELIARDYDENHRYDLMFAYDRNQDRKYGTLYLGYWNDGVVGSPEEKKQYNEV